ncbi:MAG: tRNA uridine-5-carboxymethylaminomethyl(34) synthesis enzyme MnmG [Lachnospiraceae bacterium]|nr:tRNA uridine-5-carboxymethylaminomethyl(34) synthesis enzyme MnmG [Lachnospiraceae bacterium]
MGKIIENTEKADVLVVGAGHAGCEAALAAARLGCETVLFTVSVDSIAMMPCNPNIGGTSKGHLVREVDALGGEMGRNIDKSFIQSKMLNESKGPAVHSLRAQADKRDYSQKMRETLEHTEHLRIRQAEVAKILVGDGKILGAETVSGKKYLAPAVILCTGTYLNARCVYGEVSEETGPNGLKRATHLSDSLRENGLKLLRFKTGTPARIDGRTVDLSKMEEQKGDETITPFSFENKPEEVKKQQISCYLTYTNENTHKIIRDNIDRSPLYSGAIRGTGPRYCPSIEDKVMKFPDKDRHQLFIEPEGLYTHELYISGMSSSLPEDVQEAMIRTVPGLEQAVIVRNAYAIMYDCLDPMQLKASLECKLIRGLFSAGQSNGSSGYEEAAAQGLIAGINAARMIRGQEAVVLKRSEAYIGVLIDDLVTKENTEPYRMMTSRAEYRLLLRQDNADLRLTELGHEIGLISEERYQHLLKKKSAIEAEIRRTEHTVIAPTEKVQALLASRFSTPLKSGITLAELIRRPELGYAILAPVDPERPALPDDVCEQVEISLKYEGYISRQAAQVEHFLKLERRRIPEELDYKDVGSLRIEARQKLEKFRPETLGQASRIAGVSPADVAVLQVYLEKHKNVSRETLM